MKFFFRGKVRQKLDELIKRSPIENHSNEYLNQISPNPHASLPPHVDFHTLVREPYWQCLEDNINYLHKDAKFDELQAIVFLISKVFQYQSDKGDAFQKMRDHGKLGELMADASLYMMVMAQMFVEEEPERFKPAFNKPDPAVFEDMRKAGMKEYIDDVDDGSPF